MANASDGRQAGEGGPAAGVVLGPGVVVPERALRFSFTQSSGPGGQNVNKRSTRAQLRVWLDDIPVSAPARERLVRLGGAAVTGDGEVLIVADEHRSQKMNRRACVERLQALVREAVRRPKIRLATKPSAGSVRRRLDAKRRRSEVKRQRRGPEL